ncbi:hypothetical protein [Bradyrhizobium sp. MOS002]|uniref:hypothetical protein n=1 Tax=Bradyrhizobium sp. MOS002 TaxID=2133947 RepID=UPI0011B2858F|nr:hypothetical protein [Bradyrhizobium sp. MOS002]
MTDASAETARLMNVMEAIVAELERQGGPTRYGFDPTPMARAVIRGPTVSSSPSRGPRNQG